MTSDDERQHTRGPRDAPGVMHARIVDAARLSFASHGFAGTTLRGVARGAGVDPALIHHYFSSKEALLDAATTPPPEWDETIRTAWATDRRHRPEAMVRNLLQNWRSATFRPLMSAVLLTAAHDERTKQKLTTIIARQLVAPAVEELEGDEELLRASMLASQLLGLVMMKYIWKIEPLASATDSEVMQYVTPVVRYYLDVHADDDPSEGESHQRPAPSRDTEGTGAW